MSVKYTWIIERVEVLSEFESMKDFVKTIHWRCNAEDGEMATSYGTIDLNYDKTKEFIEYSDLSGEIVIEWVKNYLSSKVNEIEEKLSEEIQRKINKNIKINDMPWISNN